MIGQSARVSFCTAALRIRFSMVLEHNFKCSNKPQSRCSNHRGLSRVGICGYSSVVYPNTHCKLYSGIFCPCSAWTKKNYVASSRPIPHTFLSQCWVTIDISNKVRSWLTEFINIHNQKFLPFYRTNEKKKPTLWTVEPIRTRPWSLETHLQIPHWSQWYGFLSELLKCLQMKQK